MNDPGAVPWAEWVALILAFVVFAAYEGRLRASGRNKPMSTARSAHAEIRARWVDAVAGRQGSEVLVVQTLRNSLMAASFMASTAVLALIGTLTLADVGSTSGPLLHHGQAAGPHELLQLGKLLLVCASFMASFFFSAMSVRYFNHTGYLLTSTTDQAELAPTRALGKAYINRAGHYYSLGLRAFFLCLPFMAALFSTYLAVPAMLVLVLLLWRFDRVGEADD